MLQENIESLLERRSQQRHYYTKSRNTFYRSRSNKVKQVETVHVRLQDERPMISEDSDAGNG